MVCWLHCFCAGSDRGQHGGRASGGMALRLMVVRKQTETRCSPSDPVPLVRTRFLHFPPSSQITSSAGGIRASGRDGPGVGSELECVSKGKQDISQAHHDEVRRLGDWLRGGWKGYEGRELGSMFSSLTPVHHLSWGGSLTSAPPVR